MTEFKIKEIGKADIQRKVMVCNFSIKSKAFFAEYGDLLSNDRLKRVISNAIDRPNKKIEFNKNNRTELIEFFQKVNDRAENTLETKYGFSTEEQSEARQAELLKTKNGSKSGISYVDRDPSSPGIETIDANSGDVEGRIILGKAGEKGMLVPLQIIEKVQTHFEFNAEKDIKKDRKTSGQFVIKNPSNVNKVWDIDLSFKKGKPASLNEEIHINNLDPNGEQVFDYEIEEFEKPALKIYEFISTLNNSEMESYSLSLLEENKVLFKINVKNIRDYPIRDITVTKEIPDGFRNIDILNTSKGEVKTNVENKLEWKIDSLDAEEEISVQLNMTIEIPDREYKPKTGKIKAEFYADRALTGIEIEKFDAYSDNFVAIQEIQEDENPDMFACAVQFENQSDFSIRIVNLDIIDPETQEKVLDIDPKEIPPLAAGAKWISKEWKKESKNAIEPVFHKKVEFFLMGNRQTSTMGEIEIEDIELAVAMISGSMNYSVDSIASYRVKPFDVLHQIKNTGGADLNDLVITETIQNGYIPPVEEDIELYILRPLEGDDISAELDPNEIIDWKNLGDPIPIASDMIEIIPNNKNSDEPHTVEVKLSNMRENPIGMITPGSLVRIKYPITANKPAKNTTFDSKVQYVAKTYPAGAPIEFSPDTITIPIEHTRKVLLKGKKVQSLDIAGEYKIILTLRNQGEHTLTNVILQDVVPKNFDHGEYSINPTESDLLEEKEVLVWRIDEIEANETIDISYVLKGVGEEYKASEAQFSI